MAAASRFHGLASLPGSSGPFRRSPYSRREPPRWPWGPSAWCSATSAPARSTPIRECFSGPHAVALDEINIFGVVSLIFWSLTMVVTVKYVAFILRADNRSEGGIFALLGLILGSTAQISPRLRAAIVLGAIFGAALLYGDGIITPAISVLSAIEGLEVATRAAKPAVVPLTCAVLVGTVPGPASGDSRHRQGVWARHGPVVCGHCSLRVRAPSLRTPRILLAVNPLYAWDFFAANQPPRGRRPRIGGPLHHRWGGVVCGPGSFRPPGHPLVLARAGFPALLLNYFGQGALLIDHPELNFHPFYGLVPSGLLYPMVALSTIATVIASQALISGVFSLTQQAIQLGLCPRVHIVHTSADVRGQIFIPGVNFALMLACIGLVLSFKESSGLAGAYGIAVTATMSLTSALYLVATIKVWRWPLWKALPLVVVFLLFDLAYFGANLLKIFDGGWITLAVAFAIMTTMTTWRKGREELKRKLFADRVPLDVFLADLERQSLARVRGTAVFMTLRRKGSQPPCCIT